ncbi:hypothetical protein [Micromonospora sp. WMMD1082]|uniref:hypothetical protein n=1 Tax=Micromonospora sp. WMMD1082 TaxID=3016104 RepID=UPI002415DB7B|nr:hypothetical protein [Micromonospora sp. WMMD1082]MDG4797416.1 hypothetical protein [Micromonospora sp. WMMD1082]
MTVVTLGRVGAVALSAGTFLFLFLNDSWRRDNLFLVPDLILCVLLVVAASLPARHAVPALLFGFGLTAGVLVTSVSSYAVSGRLGLASLVGAVAAVALAGALTGPHRRGRA